MKHTVSKIRAKKTKSRQRQAEKKLSPKHSFREHPLIGFMIGMFLLITTILVLHAEKISQIRHLSIFSLPLAGEGAFLLITLLAIAIFLKIVDHDALHKNDHLLLLSILSIASIATTKAILYFSNNYCILNIDIIQFALPFILAPLCATILIDAYVAVAVGLWTAICMAVLLNWNLQIFIIGTVATAITAQLATKVRTRIKVFKIGVIVGVGQFACVAGFTALNWQSATVSTIMAQALTSLASNLFFTILVALFLPLFEYIFKITTDITLLELSDLGHPLLQRLAIEAPGTYQHSLVVANIAQAAADEIGANALLARVCAYFHDIGKLTKPEFFAENIRLQNNPHDDLPPSMSTLVITSHVKEGISLAILHKLPRPIMDVIREHHGTSILSCFHYKATNQMEFELEKQNGNSSSKQNKVDEGAFRYEGPKPRSRESLIICLADSIEAASRTMEKSTPTHIRNLVNDITDIRFKDGQLDDCKMRLEELTKVKDSFVFSLTNMLHGRVPYPKDENKDKDKQQTNAIQSEQGKDKNINLSSDGKGTKAGSK